MSTSASQDTITVSGTISKLVWGILKAFDGAVLPAHNETRRLKDEETRFRVWAANIGAQKTGSSSLEYRLRDASHIKTQVIHLMQELADTLASAVEILRGDRIPWDLESVEDDPEEATDLREYGNAQQLKLPRTEMEQICNDVVDIVNCLLRLSVAIRSSASHDRFKASLSTDSSQSQQYYIKHVNEKYPHAKSWLIERLGKAISQRREYFKYREDHHSKLALGMNLSQDTRPADTESTVASSLPDNVQDPSFNPLAPVINEDAASDAGTSLTSNALSTVDGVTLRMPPLPKASQNGPFQCPLCYLMVAVTTTIAWRRHVYADLRPYVCLSQDCVMSGREFSRRHEWMRHQQDFHWKSFPCPCDCGETTETETELRQHIMEVHPGRYPDNLLDTVLVLRARPATKDSLSCPLCQESLLSPKQYQRHVGRHQVELALFAIPMAALENDDENEEQEQTTDVGFTNGDEDSEEHESAPDMNTNNDLKDDISKAFEKLDIVEITREQPTNENQRESQVEAEAADSAVQASWSIAGPSSATHRASQSLDSFSPGDSLKPEELPRVVPVEGPVIYRQESSIETEYPRPWPRSLWPQKQKPKTYAYTWVWTCHVCGDGLMTIALNTGCVTCGHQRCTGCSAEEIKIPA